MLKYKFDKAQKYGCFSMYYYMAGGDIGELIVYMRQGDRTVNRWYRKRSQGNQWLHALIALPYGTTEVSKKWRT